MDELAPSRSVVTSNLCARHVYRAEIHIYNGTEPLDDPLAQIHMKKEGLIALDTRFILTNQCIDRVRAPPAACSYQNESEHTPRISFKLAMLKSKTCIIQ